MRFIFLVSLLLVSTTSACSQPKGLHQKAIVAGSNNFFCVKANDVPELKRYPSKVTGILVYRRIDGVQRIVWDRDFLPISELSPSVSSEECLKGLNDRDNPLPILLPGEQYSVDIAAGIADRDGDWVRRWYSADFCVVNTGDGAEIRQVTFDRRRKVWRWDICGL